MHVVMSPVSNTTTADVSELELQRKEEFQTIKYHFILFRIILNLIESVINLTWKQWRLPFSLSQLRVFSQMLFDLVYVALFQQYPWISEIYIQVCFYPNGQVICKFGVHTLKVIGSKSNSSMVLNLGTGLTPVEVHLKGFKSSLCVGPATALKTRSGIEVERRATLASKAPYLKSTVRALDFKLDNQ